MGTTREVAEFAIKTNYDDFDADTVKWAKRIILSGVGMTMAGVDTVTGKRVLSYIKECPAPQEAGVLGAGFRTSVRWATVANGVTSHATELEDDAPPDLPTDVGYFPAFFALGEKLHVSGKELIEALVIGYDIGSKLTVANQPPEGAASSVPMAPHFCTIGVAAASAKMLKLGIEETMMAVSLALTHNNCFLWFQGGSDAHFYEQGVAMRNGIDSAMLAKHGITGRPDALEVYRSYIGVPLGTDMVRKLGDPYRVKDIGIKKYPCCYPQMQYVDTFVQLIEAHDITADDVESVQIDVAPITMEVCRFNPPKDEIESRFSLTHSIACCFLDKKPWFESFTTERAKDPQVLAFQDKLKIVVHPEWSVPESPLGAPMPIVIKMKDGTEYKKVSPNPIDPILISDEEVMDKYMKCVLRVVSQSRAAQVAETILSLDKVQDISELMTLVTFPDK